MAIKNTGLNFEDTYMGLPQAFFHVDSPTEFPAPQLVILNGELAESMGLDFSGLSEEKQAELFCGNLIPEESVPYSHA